MSRKLLQALIFRLHKIRKISNALKTVSGYLSAKGFETLWRGVANISASRRDFEMALLLDPDQAGAHAGLARVLRYYRQPEIALKHAESAEVGNPRDWHNLKIMALILRDVGHLPEAVEMLKRVTNLEPAGSERLVTKLTAQVIASAADNRYEEGLNAIFSALPKLDADSWEPYRLGWWLLKQKGDHRASQLVAVGRFVLGVGDQYFINKGIELVTVSDLEKVGAVIDSRILSLNESCGSSADIAALKQHLPHWELRDQRRIRITVLRGAVCVSSKFGTAVLVGGQLVDELSQNDALMILMRGVPDSQIFDGRVLNVAFPWGEGFFHFMMEVLPSIGAAQEALGTANIDYYLLRTRVPYQLEILAQIGIHEDKLIFSDQFPAILPSELVVVSDMVPTPPFYEAQRWSCHYIRKSLSKMGERGKIAHKRIYVSRGMGTNGRTVLNERQLKLILKKHGFVTIYPENLNFEDQVSLYQNADLIVALAGSALLNMVFCRPGTKVLVCYQPNSTWHIYQSIAEVMGIEMQLLYGELPAATSLVDPDWMEIDDNIDYEISLIKFKEILTSMLATDPGSRSFKCG